MYSVLCQSSVSTEEANKLQQEVVMFHYVYWQLNEFDFSSN